MNKFTDKEITEEKLTSLRFFDLSWEFISGGLQSVEDETPSDGVLIGREELGAKICIKKFVQ